MYSVLLRKYVHFPKKRSFGESNFLPSFCKTKKHGRRESSEIVYAGIPSPFAREEDGRLVLSEISYLHFPVIPDLQFFLLHGEGHWPESFLSAVLPPGDPRGKNLIIHSFLQFLGKEVHHEYCSCR